MTERRPFIKDWITLANGVTMSIQASAFHYSVPRENDFPFYLAYEVGYVQRDGNSYSMPQTWDRYKDGESEVWAYVPAEVVAAFIRECGGVMKSGGTVASVPSPQLSLEEAVDVAVELSKLTEGPCV